MQKSKPLVGARPNWYRGLTTHRKGDYFGSLSSLQLGETYLTIDKRHIVTRGKDDGHVHVMENICAHAGSQILSTPGVQDDPSLRCPIHKWGYDNTGKVIGAPYMCEHKQLALERPPHSPWKGYILGYDKEELGALSSFGLSLGLPENCLDAREFIFDKEVTYPLPYPRPLMLVNYFDGYHVPLFHQKTFDAVADCDSYRWEFGPADTNASYSIQEVRRRKDILRNAERLMRTHECERSDLGWAEFLLWLEEKMPHAETPIDKTIFAIWAAIYGHGYVMPELYAGGRFLAVSYLVSHDGSENIHRMVSRVDDATNEMKTEIMPNLENVVEYYVHKSVPEEYRQTALRKFKNAYTQSAREDDDICVRLWSAHKQEGISFDRVYHELLEAGDLHYRDWFLQHFVQKQ